MTRHAVSNPPPRSGSGRRRAAAIAGGIAALGASALLNAALARRAERLHPPRGRFIDVEGVRLHVREFGSGRPVLLLHGNGVTSDDFAASGIVHLLARDHRVIVPDRPGYGHSERPRGQAWTPERQADLMGGLLEALGASDPVVVGHSWGTLVTLALALSGRPLKGLVLLSGYYFPTPRADVVIMSPPAIPVVGDAIVVSISPLMARAMWPGLVRKVFAPVPVPRRFSEGFPHELAFRPSQLQASAEEAALMIPGAARLSKRYGELTLPVVIVAGDADRIADPDRQSRRLHETIASSSLAVAPGIGHMIHYAAPDAIARAVSSLAAA